MRRVSVLLSLAALFFTNGCRPLKDFDVSSGGVYDPNGFPLNPRWGKQVKNNTLPDVHSVCPVGSFDAAVWNDGTSYPNCTSVHVGFNSGLGCDFATHVNFITMTYEGTATWKGRAFWDDDYEIDVRRDEDFALYNTNSSGRVHTEFNSEETVDNWDDTGTWWDHFHHDGVDHVTCVPCVGPGCPQCYGDSLNGDGTAGGMIDGRRVTVIGMLGMDFEHNGKTELHPVYAMFVPQPTQDLRQTSWSFFVRNWGDQGFCGDTQQNLYTPENRIRFRIPNALGLLSHNMWDGSRNGGDLDQMDVTIQPFGNDVVMIFRLLPPEKQSWIVGDITFSTNRQVVFSKGTSTPGVNKTKTETAASSEEYIPFPDLEAQVDKLPPNARIELQRQLQNLTPRKKSYRIKPIVLDQQAQVDRGAYKSPAIVRGAMDETARLNRQKRVEVIKKFIADHAIK